MRRFILLMTALVMAVMTFAQRTVSGKVVEQDTQDAVIQATAALLSGEKVVANARDKHQWRFFHQSPPRRQLYPEDYLCGIQDLQ